MSRPKDHPSVNPRHTEPTPSRSGAGGFAPFGDLGDRGERDGSSDARKALEARFAARARGRGRWVGSVVRVAFVTTAISTFAALGAGYAWLDELRVFTIDESQIKTLTSTRPIDTPSCGIESGPSL